MWDLHRLSLLLDLQARGTIAAVAAYRNYSPSSVSQQLAKLQEEVGRPLTEPEGRRLRLTAIGHRLAAHAAQVLDLEEVVRADFAGGTPMPETVRVATLETAGRALLPRALTLLRSNAPHLRVEASVVPPEIGLAELETRGFDIAMAEQYAGYTRAIQEQVHREVLGADPIRIAVAADSPARALTDLRDAQWVMEPEGTAARQWAVQQCRAAGFEPDIRFTAADLQVHIHLVRAGHAVSLLPDLVWSTSRVGIRLLDLHGVSHRELFTAVRRAGRSHPGISTVRRALHQAFADVGTAVARPRLPG